MISSLPTIANTTIVATTSITTTIRTNQSKKILVTTTGRRLKTSHDPITTHHSRIKVSVSYAEFMAIVHDAALNYMLRAPLHPHHTNRLSHLMLLHNRERTWSQRCRTMQTPGCLAPFHLWLEQSRTPSPLHLRWRYHYRWRLKLSDFVYRFCLNPYTISFSCFKRCSICL